MTFWKSHFNNMWCHILMASGINNTFCDYVTSPYMKKICHLLKYYIMQLMHALHVSLYSNNISVTSFRSKSHPKRHTQTPFLTNRFWPFCWGQRKTTTATHHCQPAHPILGAVAPTHPRINPFCRVRNMTQMMNFWYH